MGASNMKGCGPKGYAASLSRTKKRCVEKTLNAPLITMRTAYRRQLHALIT